MVGFVVLFCVYNFVLHTVPLRPNVALLDGPQRLGGLPVLSLTGRTVIPTTGRTIVPGTGRSVTPGTGRTVMSITGRTKPVMDTHASDAPILNCNRIPKNLYSWTVYEEIMHQNNERKGAAENTEPLHQCSVEVELSPCSCTRTITVQLPGPCPSTSPQHLLHHIKTTLGESACGDLATLRGTGQKVVSYSVGGAKPGEYWYGVTQLAPRLPQMYLGWIMRVHIDNSINSTWMCPLACNNPHLDFCDVTQLPGLGDVSGSHPRVWRFSVMGDPLVRRYVIRDSDSPVLQREVDAVQDWLRSGTQCYHVMRDNFFHGVPMLGGMWGGCQDIWNSKNKILIARAVALCNRMDNDQAILWRLVWPVASQNGTFHDAYSCQRFPGSKPYPTQRQNYTFIGQRTYRKKFWFDSTKKKCPTACRPKEHQDWLYC